MYLNQIILGIFAKFEFFRICDWITHCKQIMYSMKKVAAMLPLFY